MAQFNQYSLIRHVGWDDWAPPQDNTMSTLHLLSAEIFRAGYSQHKAKSQKTANESYKTTRWSPLRCAAGGDSKIRF
jgi:hypothetical protein